ncbi:MAG: sigma 54-interacting transcriptional regulator, partial [Bryobacteraceae bacterium]
PAPAFLISESTSLEEISAVIAAGTLDYAGHPLSTQALRERILRALQRSPPNPAVPSLAPEPIGAELIGDSPAMAELLHNVARAAQSGANVLISGAKGTCKELVALAIHRYSPWGGGPFVVLDCAEDPVPRMRESFGGSVVLGEIAYTAPAAQPAMLEALRDWDFDSRILATSRETPERLRTACGLQRDLIDHIGAIHIAVPSLAERREDIPALALHFLSRFSGGAQKSVRFPDSTLDWLQSHAWPGNVRELEQFVERAVSSCNGGDLLPQDFIRLGLVPGEAPKPEPVPLSMDGMTREHLIRVLRYCKGNRSRAAELLEIGRYSIYRMARRLGVDLDNWGGETASAYTDLEQRAQRQSRELEAAREQLEELDRTRRGLARMLADELSTPLSAQVTALELLSQAHLEVQGPIEVARGILERVKGMLELLRAGENPVPLARCWVPATEILDAAYGSAASVARSAGVVLTRRVGDDLPPLFADARKMGQALSHLLLHAVGNTPPGGTILLEALLMHDEDSNAPVVRVSVLHEGDALEAEALAYAFDPLSSGSANASKRLGLALAKRLVSAHGGSLTIAAHPGAGNEFQILLPAHAEHPKLATETTSAIPARNEVGQA